MPFPEDLEKNPVTVGALVALTPLLIPWVRQKAMAMCKVVARPFSASDSILDELKHVRKMVSEIEYQVKTNDGGSLKDVVVRVEQGQKNLARGLAQLESYRMHDFWTRAAAGIEIRSDGHVELASEAACKLFGVSDPDELLNLSWLQFLDPHRVNTFIRAFRETAGSGSIFRFAIRISDKSHLERGEWEFKATPVGTSEPRLYSGLFVPYDATAKEFAGRNGWN